MSTMTKKKPTPKRPAAKKKTTKVSNDECVAILREIRDLLAEVRDCATGIETQLMLQD
jgi:hypothetical protein